MGFLTVKDIVSGYGRMAIVQGVSFEVNEGDTVAIIGPNGSGKSTLVKTIFGLTTVFEGSIGFAGRDITKEPTERLPKLGLAYVPQVSNVFPDLTIAENLALGFVGNRNRLAKREALEGVLKTFPILKEREGQRAGTLSGGERQMLAVERALMAQPKLLVLDEPTAALAPIMAEQLFQKLEEIRGSGVTLMIVEQNARRVLKFAKKGLVLVQGKKAFEGSPDQISNDREIIKLYLGAAAEVTPDSEKS